MTTKIALTKEQFILLRKLMQAGGTATHEEITDEFKPAMRYLRRKGFVVDVDYYRVTPLGRTSFFDHAKG